MQQNRTGVFRVKPRVILDKRFPFAKTLEVGDTGQMSANLEVEGVMLMPDADDNDMKVTTLKITKAELIDLRDTRFV